MDKDRKLVALVYGATGAIGKVFLL